MLGCWKLHNDYEFGVIMLICPICGKAFKKIDKQHLKKHGLTVEEYVQLYPNGPLGTSQETKDKIKTFKNEYKNLEKQKNIIIEKQMKLAFKINELEKTLQ